MNKTWSITLIVVASLIVLGGTYWYFGMQKPQTQSLPASEASRAPLQQDTGSSSEDLAEQPRLQPAGEAKKGLSEPEQKKKESTKPTITPKSASPSVLENPSVETEGPKAAEGETSTPKLSDAVLPAQSPTQPLVGDTQKERMKDDLSSQAEVPGARIPPPPVSNLTSKTTSQETATRTAPPPVTRSAPPPPGAHLTSKTTRLEEEEKRTREIQLSISSLDRNFSEKFKPLEKSFSTSVGLISQREVFGWGAELEVGKYSNSNSVQLSVLAKAGWNLGQGEVTFPLFISLGPTLFFNGAGGTGFGIKAKLSSSASYAIADSYRFFYTVGVGATYDFTDSTSFRFVLEPLRIGVGFSF